jgi:thiosulfate reductase cytochrome b subunit
VHTISLLSRASHTKTSLFGTSLTIPITDHKLNLGTWQGIYLAEVCQRFTSCIVISFWILTHSFVTWRTLAAYLLLSCWFISRFYRRFDTDLNHLDRNTDTCTKRTAVLTRHFRFISFDIHKRQQGQIRWRSTVHNCTPFNKTTDNQNHEEEHMSRRHTCRAQWSSFQFRSAPSLK